MIRPSLRLHHAFGHGLAYENRAQQVAVENGTHVDLGDRNGIVRVGLAASSGDVTAGIVNQDANGAEGILDRLDDSLYLIAFRQVTQHSYGFDPGLPTNLVRVSVRVVPSPYSAGPSSRIPWTSMEHPSEARCSAKARPRPRPAPVTRAVFPVAVSLLRSCLLFPPAGKILHGRRAQECSVIFELRSTLRNRHRGPVISQ